jgi:hypothetical protein
MMMMMMTTMMTVHIHTDLMIIHTQRNRQQKITKVFLKLHVVRKDSHWSAASLHNPTLHTRPIQEQVATRTQHYTHVICINNNSFQNDVWPANTNTPLKYLRAALNSLIYCCMNGICSQPEGSFMMLLSIRV